MDSAVVQSIDATDSLVELVPRVAAGDRDAEAAVLRRFERGVRLLVRRHCRANDPIAEDIAQDVLCTLVERIRAGAIEDPQALPAYVRATVVHAVAAEYRRRAVREQRHVRASTEDQSHAGAGPFERIEVERLSAAFQSLLAQLPMARDRELLQRFYLLEQGKSEVCRALGIPAGHFHRVIHRARQRFGELLMRAGLAPGEE